MPIFPAVIYWNVDPVLLDLGALQVRWYGLMFALAFLSSYVVLTGVFKHENRPPQLLERLTIYIIIGTIVGARLGHTLFYDPAAYLSNPLEILKVWEGGLASHGGALGIILASWLFARNTAQTSTLWVLDRIAIVAPLGGFFVRMGNLFNSEIVGRETDVPWAFVFERLGDAPRHPAQLYEAICYLLIFVVVYWLYRRNSGRLRPGMLLGTTLTAIFTARFFIEFIKERQGGTDTVELLLSVGQLLSIPMILVGIWLIIRSRSQPIEEPPPPPRPARGRARTP